jgi:TonB family protein
VLVWVIALPASAQIQTRPGTEGRDDLRGDLPGPPPPIEEAPGGGGGEDVDLFPTLSLARAAGWMLAPEPRDEEGRAEDQLDRYFDRTVREDQVTAGDVDGWYYDMRRRMRRAFRPDMEEAERERRAGMGPLARLVDELGRYRNGPEKPIDLPNTMPPEVANDHFDRDTQAVLEWMDQINLLNAPTNWYRVDLRVVQNPEGVVSAAWVLESSGVDALDDAALDAVRSGTVELPPPPARIVRDRFAIASDWAFEAADVATYWNTAGCVDDPVQGGVQCAVLGRGLYRTRIRLLRVVDAEHPSMEERRANEPEVRFVLD